MTNIEEKIVKDFNMFLIKILEKHEITNLTELLKTKELVNQIVSESKINR